MKRGYECLLLPADAPGFHHDIVYVLHLYICAVEGLTSRCVRDFRLTDRPLQLVVECQLNSYVGLSVNGDMAGSLIDRAASADPDCRYCLGAGLALSIAVASLVYGYLHSDVVTALGGLLFVPAAILLAGIGLTGGAERRNSEATESP